MLRMRAVRPRDLRALGEALQLRLGQAAELLAALEAGGWSARAGEYDVMLTHPGARTQDEAERLLRTSGIDLEALLIFEELDEE